MDAIILAAGNGSRFFNQISMSTGENEKPVSLIPKGLIQVAKDFRPPYCKRDTILGILVETLLQGGIDHVYIATGYKQERIESYAKRWLSGLPVTTVPPDPSLDYRKGPLYTLSGILAYLSDEKIFDRENFDKIIMIAPSDLIIDRKAIWHLAGPAGRGMMSSRSTMHVLVDDRKDEETKSNVDNHTTLKSLIPSKFHELFEYTLLQCPIVPIMAIHLNILLEASRYTTKGFSLVSEFLRAWIKDNINTSHEFKTNLNLCRVSRLGEHFKWIDVDTPAALDLE